MQYVLTEQEYADLVRVKDNFKRGEEKKLQRVCTLAAVNTPLPDCWISNHGEIRSWGCILEDEESDSYIEYCDDCPSQGACPAIKSWSK